MESNINLKKNIQMKTQTQKVQHMVLNAKANTKTYFMATPS